MNTAVVIPFQKPQVNDQEVKGMYSDRFINGYVMSSRLYRDEVRPFLSDAARNIYLELESRIHGHNKESDFVSWSQLQGGTLKGSRKLSLSTVKVGLAMLLANGVVSIIGTGHQGVKKYSINEISLVGKKVIKPTEKESSKYFGNSSTSETAVLEDENRSTSETEAKYFGNSSATTSETEDTIDNSLDSLEFKKESPPVDNFNSEIFSNSVEYHQDDQKKYSFRELANVYTIKNDFIKQAQKIKSDLTDDESISELKNFAQWTTTREATTAQGWMNYWIYRIQKLNEKKSKPKAPKTVKTKRLSDWQIKNLASELCSYSPFAGEFSNHGEQQKPFETRITANLRKPQYVEKYYKYLSELGYAFELGEFV